MSKSHSKFDISIAKDFTHKITQKPEKLNRCESCGRNFFFQETWNRHIRKCHTDMNMIRGGGENQINIQDDELDSDIDNKECDDYIVKNTHIKKEVKHSGFTEKQWGIENDENPDPAGINYKSKLPEFKKSVESLKKIFGKESVKVIGKIKSHTEEVKGKRGGGTEIKVNVTDPEGEGEVTLSIWGPHKKNQGYNSTNKQ